MFKFLVLIVCFASTLVDGQIVNNVRLVNHQEYFVRLIQKTMNIVEESGWCNLKIPDFTQDVNQTIYGWELLGTVSYKNGFLVSMGRMDLEGSTVQQIWSHKASTKESNVNVRGTFRMFEVALGFDVEVALKGKDVQHYSGVFTHESITFILSVQKSLPQNEITTAASIKSLSTNKRKMIYHPSNDVTEVLQRQYVPSEVWDGVNLWASNVFKPTMLELAGNHIEFPEICYNCDVI